jgi:hypothetical protein
LPRLSALIPSLAWRRVAVGAELVATIAVLAGCGGAQRSASSAQRTRATPLISIFEADPQLHADPRGTLAYLRRLGVDTVRVFMPWGSLGSLGAMAPDPLSRTPPTGFNGADPAAYPAANWRVYDTIIREARALGIRVDLTLGPPPPLWARGPGDPGQPAHPQWRPDAAAFGTFVHAVATRYSGRYRSLAGGAPLPRVDFWAIWNEPNFGPMIAPQTIERSKIEVSPAIYRRMVDAAWDALQGTGHGADRILIGELAPRGLSLGNGPGEFGYMVPLRFLRALYCVDGSLRPLRGPAAAAVSCPIDSAGSSQFAGAHPGLFRASGFAVHPYPQGPPDVLTADEPDYADLPALPRLEGDLDRIAHAYGANTRYPIYSTEFGYETNPPEKVFGTVSPGLAAGYLNHSEYITWRDPRIRSYDQYLLTDPARGNFATGLQFADGTAKPTLAAYRMPIYLPSTNVRKGVPVEVWGCVRPARSAMIGRRNLQRVLLQFRSGNAGAFWTLKSISLGRGAYFDVHQAFPASGAVRLTWTYPGGQTIHSRTVTITSR